MMAAGKGGGGPSSVGRGGNGAHDPSRAQRLRRRLPILLAALIALTAAVVVGLLDAPARGTDIRYPRDRETDGEVEGGGEAADAAKVKSRRDGVAPGEAEAGATLQLPGALPAIASVGGREALRRALSPPGRGHLLIDVAAITRSELARRIVRCRAARAERAFAALREGVGLDLERDIDTVGIGSDVIGLGGRLQGLRLPEGQLVERYGDDARLVKLGEGDGRFEVAVIGQGTLLIGDSRAALLAAIDRHEGRAPASQDRVGRADIEGVLLQDDLRTFADPKDAPPGSELAALLALVQQAGLRIDVDERARMSLDFSAGDPSRAVQLAGTLRSGLGLLRQVMNGEGSAELAELVDQARVFDPEGGKVGLDLAVPGEWVLRRLGCDAEGQPVAGEVDERPTTELGQQGETTLEVRSPTETSAPQP